MSQQEQQNNTGAKTRPIQPRINTRCGVNMDTAFSVALVGCLVPEFENAEIFFRDAGWSWQMGPMEVAIDLDAGGVSFMAEPDSEGRVRSTFDLIRKTYGPQANDKRVVDALEPLAQYLDNQKAYGSEGIRMIAPSLTEADAENVSDFTLAGVFRRESRAIRGRAKRLGESPEWADYQIVCWARDHLREYISEKISYMNAEANVVRAIHRKKIIMQEGGAVALCLDPIKFVQEVLFRNYGIRAVVIVEDTDNIVVRRKDSEQTRMDHLFIREVLGRFGEKIGNGQNDWFSHPSGFLLAWQTRRGEQRGRGTKVDPWDMAEAVERAILFEDARIAQSK
ncbi:MAG: hypothetical protein WC813_04795 [Patescibacteria group bacterium]|jgi:hypothetical protein